MTEQFSQFTLNKNLGAKGNSKAPTMKGSAKVLIDGSPTEFDVAAWGPNTAQTGGPDYYNVTLDPKDPALNARQLKTELKPGDVPNAIQGFELTRLGSGKIFERTEEEIAKARTQGKNLSRFYGHALVLTRAGVRAVDLSAWARDGFYSGNANLHDPDAAASARAAASGRPVRAPRLQNG
jgi:hypothetical protein